MRIMSNEAPNSNACMQDMLPPSRRLRLASLFSGGKDSACATYEAQKHGHTIACLISICGRSDESMLLHNPNIRWVGLQAEAMHDTPLISCVVDSDETAKELDALESALRAAKSRYNIQGVVHGGIRSEFQRSRFETACSRLGLDVVAPLWRREPAASYMSRLLDEGFDFIVGAVSADGLDDAWLGRHITRDALAEMSLLSERYGFALDFEGGEAETFVTHCPLFKRPIIIHDYNMTWDGYRGRFEILGAGLYHDA